MSNDPVLSSEVLPSEPGAPLDQSGTVGFRSGSGIIWAGGLEWIQETGGACWASAAEVTAKDRMNNGVLGGIFFIFKR